MPDPEVFKTASVRVAAGDQDQVYGSIEEVPPQVRQKMEQALSGPHAETIVIADERTREAFQAPAGQRSRRVRWWLLAVLLASLAVLLRWIWTR